MPKFIFAFALLIIAFAAQAQVIAFDTTHIDYGYLPQYTKDNKRIFKFTNIGTQPLVIESVQTSCGCLVATYPQHPILPNESGEIIAKYDTNRTGLFVKYITVSSNATNFINLEEAGRARLKVTGDIFKCIDPNKIAPLKQQLHNNKINYK
jgi:hypothetical protein